MSRFWIYLMFAAMFSALAAGELEISMEGSHALAAAGDNVSFVCRVAGGGAGVLVYLNKQVIVGDSKYTELIATNDILTPVYDGLGRFKAEVVDVGDATLFILNINGVTELDTGYYGCVDPRTLVGDSTRLEVYKQASEVYFVDHAFNDPYVFTEGVPQEVQCIVDDVVPVSNVRISIGDRDYTDDFIKATDIDVHCTASEQSKSCPLYYHYNITMKHSGFQPDYTAHGNHIICQSNMQVPYTGMAPIQARAKIIVNYAPRYFCDMEQQAAVYEPYNITCNVTTYPPATLVMWSFVIAGEYFGLQPGEAIGGFSVEEKLTYSAMRSYILVISEVQPHFFTTYSLRTEQQLANSSFNVTLTQQFGPGYKIITTETIGAGSSSIMTSCALLWTLLALLYVS